jgi:hypothetical protein
VTAGMALETARAVSEARSAVGRQIRLCVVCQEPVPPDRPRSKYCRNACSAQASRLGRPWMQAKTPAEVAALIGARILRQAQRAPRPCRRLRVEVYLGAEEKQALDALRVERSLSRSAALRSLLSQRKGEKTMVKLGEQYTDTITGFTGIATARSEFLYGCVRVQLEMSHHGKEYKPTEAQWFDEQRLIRDSAAQSGGPGAAAPSRDCPAR